MPSADDASGPASARQIVPRLSPGRPVRAICHAPPTVRPASVDHHQPGRCWMFRCQLCATVTPPNTSAERVVVATRPRVYPARREANREIVWKPGLKKWAPQDDPGGTGWEIVREITVCPPCKLTLDPVPVGTTS
jgi:hypothetical protein